MLFRSGVWKKEWVVHCEAVGSGEAAFKYLAPYVFRVAISNSRILKLEEGRVTFKYKDSATDQVKLSTVSAEEFIRRFLQHVLPDGFVKVRYFGLLASGNRNLLKKVRESLSARSEAPKVAELDRNTRREEMLRCPSCGGEMTSLGTFKRNDRGPP